ncbi:helix-turn-helix transcriptional regulator [Gluconobacter sp. GP1]|uniref:helix-turn-helix domain-containing protein n=1 Tax=Gluconobacter sp. GP1 TaxID=3046423 RepID=UPI00293F47DE|nr:helix-turn-helix transcriptional regulator [Gluconobacter sp. GP1]
MEMMKAKTVGQRIKEARLLRKMGQAELAAALTVSVPTISEWENDKKTPSVERREDICKILDVSMEYIFGDYINDKNKYFDSKYPFLAGISGDITAEKIDDIMELFIIAIGEPKGRNQAIIEVVGQLIEMIKNQSSPESNLEICAVIERLVNKNQKLYVDLRQDFEAIIANGYLPSNLRKTLPLSSRKRHKALKNN